MIVSYDIENELPHLLTSSYLSPPIPIEEISLKLGYKVDRIDAHLLEKDCIISVSSKNSKIIKINRFCPEKIQRLAVACQIGMHLTARKTKSGDIPDNFVLDYKNIYSPFNEFEKKSSKLALQLLLPEHLIQPIEKYKANVNIEYLFQINSKISELRRNILIQ